MNIFTNMKTLLQRWFPSITFEIMGHEVVLPVLSSAVTCVATATAAIIARTYPPVGQWLDADAHLSHGGAVFHVCVGGAVVGTLALIVVASVKHELRKSRKENEKLKAEKTVLLNEVENTIQELGAFDSERRRLKVQNRMNQATAEPANPATQPPPSKKSKGSRPRAKPESASATSAA
jgi:hypothetical protein